MGAPAKAANKRLSRKTTMTNANHNDVMEESVWDLAYRKLTDNLQHAAIRIRRTPADGDCFYHAVADKLASLGHAYTAQDLKRLAGASGTDEAEQHHIAKLVQHPVPLCIRLVPVELSAPTLFLNWDSAHSIGHPASPTLSLVRWTIN